LIAVKSRREIDLKRRAGALLAGCFLALEPLVVEGARTRDLDRFAGEYFRKRGGVPSFLGVPNSQEGAPPFPANMCISINEEVIHGLPGPRALRGGDVVSVDMGVVLDGYHSDMARTYLVGEASDLARRLVEVTRRSFFEGIRFAVPGKRVSDIARGVQRTVEEAGFSVVREYVGHGIGTQMHEEPQIPNFLPGPRERLERLSRGMTLAVEPMVNAGGHEVEVLPDRWTVVTRDRSLSAHYENTVLVGEPPVILSAPA
jgi:methionyl aminopeptidase